MEINESMATNVNGKLSGQVSKSSEDESNASYLKIDLLNDRDNLMGTEYVDISDLGNGQKKDFNINFNYKDVKKYVITTVDNMEESLTKTLNGKYVGISVLLALIVLQTVI